RRGRHGRILAAVEAQQLVAEEQRRRRAEAALAELLETEIELPRHADQQLEVRRAEAERAALYAAFGAAELGFVVGTAGGGFRRAARRLPVSDADLVRENLLRRSHLVERLRVQDLLQLRDEKLVGEHRELDQEPARLSGAEFPAAEPARVRIGRDGRMA